MMKISFFRVFTFMVLLLLGIDLNAQSCKIDTFSTDIILVIDNGQSIDEPKFNSFKNLILTTINKVKTKCPNARIAVVHYGGANGNNTVIEYPLSSNNNFTSINRQFCTSINSFGFCIGGGGDDLNAAMGNIRAYFQSKELPLSSKNNLNLVIFTDASSIDATCTYSNCSLIRPFANIDLIKSTYNARVTVVGASEQVESSLLAIYASPGGSFVAKPLSTPDCISSFDGCQIPRRYVPVEFISPSSSSLDSIVSNVNCMFSTVGVLSISAGTNKSICDNSNQTVSLTASVLSGTPSYSYFWSHGLGTGSSKSVSPAFSTNYKVTVTDANGCSAIDSVTVFVNVCGTSCSPDTILNDIVLLIDNGQSIDDSKFNQLRNIVLTTINMIKDTCAGSRISVVHYGGSFGNKTSIEHNFGSPTITQINRQYCATRDASGFCIGGGGDDLNGALGNILGYIQSGQLSVKPKNKFKLLIFTDAVGFDTNCGFSNCSLIRPITNVDSLKSRYKAQVTVAGLSNAQASVLGIYASPGGSYNSSPLYSQDCLTSIDGCFLPRKYVPIDFNSNPVAASLGLLSCIDCKLAVSTKVLVDAGESKTICSNYNETATLTATALSGTPPFTYSWSNNLGSGSIKVVKPSTTTKLFVTMTDGSSCTSIDSVLIIVKQCNECRANAGRPLALMEYCLENNRANLNTEKNIGVNIPSGQEEVYILTDELLTILDYSIGPKTYAVSRSGRFRIHTFIAEVTDRNSIDYFDLNIIKKGSSNLFTVTNALAAKNICADFDLGGRTHLVHPSSYILCLKAENSLSLCSDGRDNDSDGLIDCKDPDCKKLVSCLENTFLACNDLFDNDLDGLVDCFDPDCWAFVRCFERENNCGDGIDNDGDGKIDCDDDGCLGSRYCTENDAFTCSDGKDNDKNGLIDCQEASCKKYLVCAEYSIEACSDGKDNDYDGLIDCADSHCREIYPSVCVLNEVSSAHCRDGKDNDGDGLVDCKDPGCKNDSNCTTPSTFLATTTLSVTAFLEGPYDPVSGQMTTSLNDQGYLPGQKPSTFFGIATKSGQPYSGAPWFYSGEEGSNMKKGSKNASKLYGKTAVDWVLISFRSKVERSSEVWKSAAIIHSDGYIELQKEINIEIIADGYYIVIEHRNHLPVMSHQKVKAINGEFIYDFTAQDAYSGFIGVGQKKLQNGLFALFAGNGEIVTELSSDIDINVRDLAAWLFKNGLNSSYFIEDYDLNGDINIKDRIIWEKNNGLFSTLQTK